MRAGNWLRWCIEPSGAVIFAKPEVAPMRYLLIESVFHLLLLTALAYNRTARHALILKRSHAKGLSCKP